MSELYEHSYPMGIKIKTDIALTEAQKTHVLDLIRSAVMDLSIGTLNTEDDEENGVPDVHLLSVEANYSN